MRDLWNEITTGARVFRGSPGLAAGVAITIGLGVGTSLAIFALLQDTLIGRSPFADPASLVVVENTGSYYYEGRVSEGLASPRISVLDFEDIEAQVRTLAAVGTVAQLSGVMTGGDRPRPVWRTLVSPKLLPLLGARPRLGRILQPADFEADAPPAAVLTDSMWRRHFGADSGIVGKSIHLDDQAFTVVGVVPDAVLRFISQPSGLLDRVQDRQVISPNLEALAGGEARLLRYLRQQRDAPWFQVVGRVAPGRSVAEAGSEIAVVAQRLAAEHPATNARRGLRVTALDAWRTANVRGTTMMLLAAALLVFLVASGNAAGLVLAESVGRETDTAVRQALGAGSARLVRLEFVRSIVLALPGGILAIALAGLTLLVVDRTLADGGGAILRALVVPRVVLAGLGTTVLAGLIAGAGAAWSLRRRNISETLKEGGLTASVGRRRLVATRVLVGLQVAAATALVLGAGLMLQSVWNIVSVDLGFDVQHSLVMQLRLPPAKYPKGEDQRAFLQQALQRIRSLPGVTAAGAGITAPLTGTSYTVTGLELELSSGERRGFERLNVQSVMPGYLEALDMRLVRGRWFADADYAGGRAVLVDQAFCGKYLDGVDPMQARVIWGRSALPIVGIVADVRRDGPFSAPADTVYAMESFERPARFAYLVVRAAGPPMDVGLAVLREVTAIDPTVSAADPQSVKALFEETCATRRRLLMLVGGAALVVVFLTAFSLLSALGQFVAARRREIAVRLALGANGRHITGLLGRHIAVALGAGLVAGAAGGLLLGGTLEAELYGVTPFDSATIAESLSGMVLLAVIVSIGPLWRAQRINPATSLRAQ